MPSRLGPKSSRVTNANHEIDKYMHKRSMVACSQFRISLNPQVGFCKLDHTVTKRGLESVLKAQKHIWEPVESAASKGGGLGYL